MGRWGDGSDDDGVDAFGDAIKEEVPIVYGSLADLRLNTARQQADEAGAAAAAAALAPTASSTASDTAVATGGSVSGSMSPGREAAVAAGSAYASLDLSIPHHKLVTPGGDRRRSHVVYIVQCQGPERAWQVRKRFSEFHALHAALVEANARHVPPFPSKMKRFMESEEALAKRRMAQLQEYLVAVGVLAAKGRLRVAALDSFLREERRDGAVGAVAAAQQDLEGSSRHASPREYEQDEEGFVKLTATPWTPYTTVVERPTEHLIVLDVPGMDRSQLQLAVLDNGVRVYGERTLDIANSSIVHNDRAFGSFAIDFIIPEQYAPYTNVTTDLKRGCLYVTLRVPGYAPYLSTLLQSQRLSRNLYLLLPPIFLTQGR